MLPVPLEIGERVQFVGSCHPPQGTSGQAVTTDRRGSRGSVLLPRDLKRVWGPRLDPDSRSRRTTVSRGDRPSPFPHRAGTGAKDSSPDRAPHRPTRAQIDV